MTAISNLRSPRGNFLFPPTYFDKYYFRLNCILVKYPAPPFCAEGFFLDSAGGIFFFESLFFLKRTLHIYSLWGISFFYGT